MEKELLEHFRAQVKTIDLEIIYLLSRRFENVKQIGLLKKELNLETHQADVWKELLSDIQAEGKERLIDKNLIDNIWSLIHDESKKIQSKLEK